MFSSYVLYINNIKCNHNINTLKLLKVHWRGNYEMSWT